MKNYNGKKEHKRKSIAGALSDDFGLPIDAFGGVPYIQINAGRELIVDGCCKIISYDSGEICSVCGKTLIRITGACLEVKLMDKGALVIGGHISSISFEEK